MTAFLRLCNSRNPLILELGCGNKKVYSESIGIDIGNYPAVDFVGDAIELLGQLPEGSVDMIYSSHLIEHVDDVREFLIAMVRVLKVGSSIEIIVPHFSNPFFYSDPTHKTTFGLYTCSYFATSDLFSRSIPGYSLISGVRLDSVKLGFKSYRPNYLRHSVKMAFGYLINSSNWLKEFYEECLCWLFSCYEIHYKLIKF